jgi:hypothetical protein
MITLRRAVSLLSLCSGLKGIKERSGNLPISSFVCYDQAVSREIRSWAHVEVTDVDSHFQIARGSTTFRQKKGPISPS